MSQKIDQFLSAQNVPGVVALGTTATNTIYEGAFGMTNTETKSAINIDTPHAIMSMTKPITSFAIMQLVESGKIDLDAPATDYISRYQGLVVLDQVNLANKSYTTGALERNFSIRHLTPIPPGLVIPFAMTHFMAFDRQQKKTISRCYISLESSGAMALPPGF
jgi:methyl acetate hydrolase